MKERIDAVQRLFWVTLGVAVALLIANLTGGGNGAKMSALRELEGFAANFDRPALEGALLERALGQVRVPLSRIAALASGAPGVPSIAANEGALEGVGQVTLATLGDLHKRRKASQADLRLVDVDELAAGIAFRLARTGRTGDLRLQRVEVDPGAASSQDRERFERAEAARRHSIDTRKRFGRSEQKFERLDTLLTQRRKWKASRKVIARSFTARMEAKAERDALRKELDAAKARYQALATEAERFEAGAARTADADAAVATVVLADGDGDELVVRIPVAIRGRSVGVPKMDGVAFTETLDAGLWDAVGDQTPAQAVDTARGAFGWHYRFVEVGSVKLGGLTLLHLWPLALPILLFVVRKRTQVVSAGYDPYAARGVELPDVGTGYPAGDIIVLIVLPAIACLWTAYSLIQIGQWPLTALAGAVAGVALGGFALREFKDLRSLTAAVLMSHSRPPGPLPDAAD